MLSLTSIFIVPDVECIAVLFLFILKYSKGLHPMKMKACTVKMGIAQTMKKHPCYWFRISKQGLKINKSATMCGEKI